MKPRCATCGGPVPPQIVQEYGADIPLFCSPECLEAYTGGEAGDMRFKTAVIEPDDIFHASVDAAWAAMTRRAMLEMLQIELRPGETPLRAWMRDMARLNHLADTVPPDALLSRAILARVETKLWVWFLLEDDDFSVYGLGSLDIRQAEIRLEAAEAEETEQPYLICRVCGTRLEDQPRPGSLAYLGFCSVEHANLFTAAQPEAPVSEAPDEAADTTGYHVCLNCGKPLPNPPQSDWHTYGTCDAGCATRYEVGRRPAGYHLEMQGCEISPDLLIAGVEASPQDNRTLKLGALHAMHIVAKPAESPLAAWLRATAEANDLPHTKPINPLLQEGILANKELMLFLWWLSIADEALWDYLRV